jgi:hypothetical protein
MVGAAVGRRYELGTTGAFPTTSPRATRPQRGGKLGEVGRRFRRQVPPHCGPVGLRQVDGMAPRIVDGMAPRIEASERQQMP